MEQSIVTGDSDERTTLGRRDLLKGIGLAGLVAVTPTGLSATQTTGSWTTYRADPRNTGTLTGVSGPLSETVTDWAHDSGSLPDHVYSAGDRVVVNTSRGSVHVVDATDGTRQWTDGEDDAEVAGVVEESIVQYVDDTVVARSLADGTEQWRTDLPGSVGSMAVGEAGIFLTTDEHLLALGTEAGQEQWRMSTSNVRELRVVDETLVARDYGHVRARTTTDGSELWEQEIPLNLQGLVVTESSVTIAKERVMIESFALADGDRRWEIDFGDSVNGLAADADTVFVAGYDAVEARSSADGSIEWTTEADRGSGSATLTDGALYLQDDDGLVIVLSADDGEERWRASMSDGIRSLAFGDDDVVTAVGDGTVYSLGTANGTEAWRYETGGEVVSEPAVGDSLYVGTSDGDVQALDPASGERQWQFETGETISGTPTVADGVVYVATREGAVVALDAADGTELWSRAPQAATYEAAPVLADGTLCVAGGSAFDVLHTFDPETGDPHSEVQDRENTHFGFEHPPAVTDTHAYVPIDGTLYAVDLDDRSFSLFEVDQNRGEYGYSVRSRTMSPPAISDGTAYLLAGRSSELFAVDLADETNEWTLELDGRTTTAPPAVDGDTVYAVAHHGRTLYAVSASDGSVRWRYETASEIEDVPPVVTDDTVYVATETGLVAVSKSDQSARWRADGLAANQGLGVADGVVYAVNDDGIHARVEAVWPEPTFSVTPAEPALGEEITVDASESADPDGEITRYRWDFTGDGSFEPLGESTTHTYAEPGEHTVTLELTDSHGLTATAERTVSVTDPSTPTPTAEGATEQPTVDDATDSPTATNTESTEPSTETTTSESGPGFDLAATVAGTGIAMWRAVTRRESE